MLDSIMCKDEGFGPGPDFHSGMGHGQQLGCPDIMVPAPNGTNDTQNILDAIALAQAKGPGSVVQLQKGTYFIGFTQIRDFVGTIKGCGKGQTIVKPVADLPCHEEALLTGCVSLLTFIGGDVTLKDMSFKIDDVCPCSQPYVSTYLSRDLYILIKFIDRFHNLYDPENRYIKATVENIDFEGGIDGQGEEAGPYAIYNVCATIWFGHDYSFTMAPDETRSCGDMTVSNCTFRKVWCAIDIAGVGGGKLVTKNNKFLNIGSPLFYFDIINTEGIISGNLFDRNTIYDILIDDMDYGVYGFYPYSVPVKRAIWKITNNIFNTKNFG